MNSPTHPPANSPSLDRGWNARPRPSGAGRAAVSVISGPSAAFEEGRAELKTNHAAAAPAARVVHGGIVSYLADNALTFAGALRLPGGRDLGVQINYVRPAIAILLAAPRWSHTAPAGGRRCDVYVVKDGVEGCGGGTGNDRQDGRTLVELTNS